MSKTCPFCASENITVTAIPVIYFNDRTFHWYKCSNCALIFILPFLTNDDLKRLYSPRYHEEFYFKYSEHYTAQLNLIKKYPGKKVLDYGCGDAGFLDQLNKIGYQTYGVEYDPELVNKLANKFSGSSFFSTDAFWKEAGSTYDIIHLSDVLEHMNEPAKLIERLKEKLSGNGLFFIEGPLETNPNLACFFRMFTTAVKKMVNEDSTRVKEPYHVSFSNAANQKLLFKNAGLELIYFKTWEHGWPYIDSFREIRSSWLLVQWMIVKISILLSSLIPTWGNRFYYIGRPILKQPV